MVVVLKKVDRSFKLQKFELLAMSDKLPERGINRHPLGRKTTQLARLVKQLIINLQIRGHVSYHDTL